jgi:hypothetical protein
VNNIKNLAPIVLFVYNRPYHTLQTINSLKNNILADQSDLVIYADGPKDEQNSIQVQEVINYLQTIDGFKTIHIHERKTNYGLAQNIIDGVSQTLVEHNKAIIVEDDLVTSPYFLQYMNDALDYYAEKEDVACIHGYVYPLDKTLPKPFFLKGADCWGWGTWKRAWDLFEPDGQILLDRIIEKGLAKEFDFDNSYPYLQMLKNQIAGLNNSWAIRWYASAFLKNKLVLYPNHSLVQNIGHDSSGTHSGVTSKFDIRLSTSKVPVEVEIAVSKAGYKAFVNYFNSIKAPNKMSFGKKIKNSLKNLLK